MMRQIQIYEQFQADKKAQKIIPVKISKRKQNRIYRQKRLFQSLAQAYLGKKHIHQVCKNEQTEKSKTGRYFKPKDNNELRNQRQNKSGMCLRSQKKSSIQSRKEKLRKIYSSKRNNQYSSIAQSKRQVFIQKSQGLRKIHIQVEQNVQRPQKNKINQSFQKDIGINIHNKINQKRYEIKSSLQQYRKEQFRKDLNISKNQDVKFLRSTFISKFQRISQVQSRKQKLKQTQQLDQSIFPFSPQSIIFKKNKREIKDRQIRSKDRQIGSKERSNEGNTFGQFQQESYQKFNQQLRLKNRDFKLNQLASQSQARQKGLIDKNSSGNFKKKGSANFPFVFQSQDMYIKKWLIEHQWAECTRNYENFKLKWSYKQYLTDYNILNRKRTNNTNRKMQYYNHIKNNKILSKEGLSQIFFQMNLLQQSPYYFIPRSYSLTNNTAEFQEDYFITSIMCALKKIIKKAQIHGKQKSYAQIQQKQVRKAQAQQTIQADIMQITLKTLLKKLNFINHYSKLPGQLQNNQVQKFEETNSANWNFSKTKVHKKRNQEQINFTVYVFLSIVLQIQVNKLQGNDQIFQKELNSMLGIEQKSRIIQFLQQYFYVSYNSTIKKNQLIHSLQRITSSYSFLRRAQLLLESQNSHIVFRNDIIKILKSYYSYFQKKQPIKFRAQGDHNIWIVKPTHGSRGIGIQMLNSYTKVKKALQLKSHSKIIQKYIQNVWILDSMKIKKAIQTIKGKQDSQNENKSNKIQNENKSNKIQKLIKLYKSAIFLRKFDVRQWVLLYPPCSYIFSKFYLKICSSQYQVKGNSIQSHLSNYSVNKSVFIQNNEQTESILREDQLYSILRQLHYQEQTIINIRRNITDRIKKVLYINQQFLDKSEGCFQLIGFDIILDNELNPWIIEANMSPACSQRSQWLQNMKKRMADQMFKIIFAKQKQLHQILSHSNNSSKLAQDAQLNWIQIQRDKQQDQFYNKKYVEKLYLEALGKKIKIKKRKQELSQFDGQNQNQDQNLK